MAKIPEAAERPERIESGLLRRINERRLFETLQQHGPASRASLTRLSGLTAPTVSKAIESLLSRGFVEETDPTEQTIGRPGKLIRLATESAVVLGVVIDVENCSVTATGLDGRVAEPHTSRFATPTDYLDLLDAIDASGRALVGESLDRLQGVGVSVPGLVNDRL
ncbi:MAG: N-acetylglucosamine repressor, partial [Planctomycetota bacterium]